MKPIEKKNKCPVMCMATQRSEDLPDSLGDTVCHYLKSTVTTQYSRKDLV